MWYFRICSEYDWSHFLRIISKVSQLQVEKVRNHSIHARPRDRASTLDQGLEVSRVHEYSRRREKFFAKGRKNIADCFKEPKRRSYAQFLWANSTKLSDI